MSCRKGCGGVLHRGLSRALRPGREYQIVRDFLPGDRGEALFDKMKREIADALAIPFEMGRHKRHEAALTRTHWRTLRA